LDDAPAVTLAGPANGQRRELLHGFALFRDAEARFAASFRLAVECLRYGCRAADVANAEDVDLKAAGIVFDLQAVAGMNIACGFGALAIGFDPAYIAGARGDGAGFEEARGPEPFVDAHSVHGSILRRGVRVRGE